MHEQRCRFIAARWFNGTLEVGDYSDDDAWPVATLRLLDGRWRVLNVELVGVPMGGPKFD